MSCIICNKKSKPWLLLNNYNLHVDEEGKLIGKTIQTCGYSCCKKLNENLPKNYSHLVMNKEDFCYLRPVVTSATPEFVMLTYGEIVELTDQGKEEYYKKKENHIDLDVNNQLLHDELEQEDMNTFNIENQGYTSSDNEHDDYYD